MEDKNKKMERDQKTIKIIFAIVIILVSLTAYFVNRYYNYYGNIEKNNISAK